MRRSRKFLALAGALALAAGAFVAVDDSAAPAQTASEPPWQLNVPQEQTLRVSCQGTGSTYSATKVSNKSVDVKCSGPSAPTTTTTTTRPPSTTTTRPPSTTTTVPPTTTTLPPSGGGGMPTAANTGPATTPTQSMTAAQFLSSRTCENRRISGEVRIESYSRPGLLGQTFTIRNCVIDRLYVFIEPDLTYTPAEYPTINLESSDVLGFFGLWGAVNLNMSKSYVGGGAFWAPCGNCASNAPGGMWNLQREMRVNVTDSWFFHPQGQLPDHTEALHVAGSGQGYRFTNTRFSQAGPYNDTQTAALFFHGGSSTFDRNWFDWSGGAAAAYYTVYVYGTGSGAASNVVTGSAFARGIANYVYPNMDQGTAHATYTGNRDITTGAPVTFP